jgi:molecular chaperone IbpA
MSLTFRSPNFIGFDRLLDTFDMIANTHSTTFPHHNIVREGNKYTVELAVAGFSDKDIDIEVEKNVLHIRGIIPKQEPNDKVEYLHRGIANRSFHKLVQLYDTIEVTGADLNNGILTVNLENIIPEEKKAKKIALGSVGNKQQLLNE